MRRATAVGVIGLALVLLTARPAFAQWDWFKWIQELSGPGPFELHGVTVTFACGEEPAAGRAEEGGTAAYRYFLCDKHPDRWRNVKRFWGVTFAAGDGENNLDFPASLPKRERVTASLYLVRGAFRVHDAVDVGGAAGFMRLSGTPDITTTKYVLDPYVAIRPFALVESDHDAVDFLARAIEVNAGMIIFPQGFRLSDFGAIGGVPDWEGKPEVSFHWGLRITFLY